MKIPERMKGLKLVLAVMMAYTAVWMALEGNLWRAVAMGAGWTAVLLLYLAQNYLGGRQFGDGGAVGLTAVGGLLFGFLSGASTLFFMILKTGIHAHGPEFSAAEINQIIGYWPFWTVAGALAGLGGGLIWLAVRNRYADGAD